MPVPRPVLFFAFANDRGEHGAYLRNLPEEARRVAKALKPAAGLCEIVVHQNATAEQVFDTFQEHRDRIAVFHYAGHANGYQLLLESVEGSVHAVGAGGLAAFLGQQHGLQLVFLNGCSTQPHVEALLAANVPAVVATARAIDDRVATEFAARFYQGLTNGASIGVAFREADGAARAAGGGLTRTLLPAPGEKAGLPPDDRPPWSLSLHPGARDAGNWNIPAGAGDPLFGLPPLPPFDRPDAPYRHLLPFARAHAHLFFGRGQQVRDLYLRVAAPGTAPVVLLYGQAGAGKSSLLDAGLLPRFEVTHEVRYLRRLQEGGLLDTLRLAFLPEGAELPLNEAWRAKERETGKPLIVVLDQVEEAYTRPNPRLPNELTDLLDGVRALFADPDRRPRGRLVLSFRKEWLPEIEKQLGERRVPRAEVFLERLDRAGVAEAVRLSAEVRGWYGLEIEAGLPERIADDLLEDPNSPVAPTLQVLLATMWDAAKGTSWNNPVFDGALYDSLKRQGLHLGDFLDRQLGALQKSLPGAVASGLALDVLAFHTTPLGTAGQRGERELLDTYGHQAGCVKELVLKCKDLYLLTDWREDQTRYEPTTRLAHDTLAPLVRKRFDESDAPGQRARRLLDNRSPEWATREGTSLDGTDLAVVEAGATGTRQWSDREGRLIEASRRRRQVRRRTVLLARTAGVVAVAVIAGLAIQAWSLNDNLRGANKDLTKFQKKLETTNEELAGTNDTLQATLKGKDLALREVRKTMSLGLAGRANSPDDPQRNLLLTAEAVLLYRRSGDPPIPTVDQAFRGALGAVEGRGLIGPPGGAGNVTVSPDQRWVVATGGDGTGYLWDLRAEDPVVTRRVLPGAGTAVGKAQFSNNGRWLLLISGFGYGGTATLWDLTSSDPQAGRVVLSGAFAEHDFTADGRWLWAATRTPENVFLSPKRVVRLWDLQNGTPTREGRVLADYDTKTNATSAAASPNGRWLLTGCDAGEPHLWDLKSQAPESRPVLVHGTRAALDINVTHQAEFSLDGRWLVTSSHGPSADSSFEGVTQLWDLSAAAPPIVLEKIRTPKHVDTYMRLKFSPKGRWLLTNGFPDNVAKLWKLGDGTTGSGAILLSPPPAPLTWRQFESSAFGPDDRTLAIGTSGIRGHQDAVAFVYDLESSNPSENKKTILILEKTNAAIAGNSNDFLIGVSTILELEFSPQSDRLIARVWNSKAFERVAQFWQRESSGEWVTPDSLRKEAPFSEAWFGPAQRVLIAKRDGAAVLWSPHGELVLGLGGQFARFSADGRWLVTDGNDSASLWELPAPNAPQTGKHFLQPTPLRGHPTAARSNSSLSDAQFIPGEPPRWLLTTGSDGPRLWDLRAIRDSNLPTFVLSPDRIGKFLCRACDLDTAPTELAGGAIVGDTRRIDSWASPAYPGEGRFLAAIGVRKRLALATRGGIRLFDLTASKPDDSGVPIPIPGSPIGDCPILMFSPNGERLACVNQAGKVYLWRIDERGATVIALSAPGHERPVRAAAFSRDGQWLATGGDDNAIRIWNTTTGQSRPPLLEHKGSIRALAYGAGEKLISGGADGVVVWDLNASGDAPASERLERNTLDVNLLVVSADGRWLFSVGRDGGVLSDLRARPLSSGCQVLPNRKNSMLTVPYAVFSPNGRWLFVSGSTLGACLWSLDDPLGSTPIDLPNLEFFEHATFSRDSRWLITTVRSRIYRMPVSVEDMLTEAKIRAGRQFTPEEWDRYFPGQKYRSTFEDIPAEEARKNGSKK